MHQEITAIWRYTQNICLFIIIFLLLSLRNWKWKLRLSECQWSGSGAIVGLSTGSTFISLFGEFWFCLSDGRGFYSIKFLTKFSFFITSLRATSMSHQNFLLIQTSGRFFQQKSSLSKARDILYELCLTQPINSIQNLHFHPTHFQLNRFPSVPIPKLLYDYP